MPKYNKRNTAICSYILETSMDEGEIMKIKLAILENDINYLNRIVNVLNTKYTDKFEVYSFTNEKVAMSVLESARIDVLVASEFFEIDMNLIPQYCAFAYFANSPDVDTINGQRAICKYQKTDLIYREILHVFSEKNGKLSGLKVADDGCNIIIFNSPSGGAGSSIMAASCARRYSLQGKKVLYLNLEKLGSSDLFFTADGQFDMSDILFAIKSKKTKLAFKIESCVKKDQSGVMFFSPTKYALDMMDLTVDDLMQLLHELQITGFYEYIIVDMDYEPDVDYLKLYNCANEIIWVSDGSNICNSKCIRAYQAMQTLEQDMNIKLTRKILFIYNKYNSKTGSKLDDVLNVKSVGVAPRYSGATTEQVMAELSAMDMFDKII